MFRVGQKVVCVDDEPKPGYAWYEGKPTKGHVYTVVRAGISPLHNVPVVWLLEISNTGPSCRGVDIGYCVTRFRPAVDRPTDISCFKALLRDRELVS